MEYEGVVEGGGKRAAALGFPTANISFEGDASGIFAARVALEGKEYKAVAYADPVRGVIESHLFDFEGDLYGKRIGVDLLEKLRESTPFADEKEAQAQIARDVEAAHAYFASCEA